MCWARQISGPQPGKGRLEHNLCTYRKKPFKIPLVREPVGEAEDASRVHFTQTNLSHQLGDVLELGRGSARNSNGRRRGGDLFRFRHLKVQAHAPVSVQCVPFFYVVDQVSPVGPPKHGVEARVKCQDPERAVNGKGTSVRVVSAYLVFRVCRHSKL